jgi:hypothetical protein
MKIEMSSTLSMLMIGANQPVVRKRGYEMTKNVRAIFRRGRVRANLLECVRRDDILQVKTPVL